MGKRSDFEKRPQDQYLTPLAAVTPLVPFLPPNVRFYEPCAGDGRLVDHIQELVPGAVCTGYSDIDPEGSRKVAAENHAKVYRTDVAELDAFDLQVADVTDAGMFITNPPWTRTAQSGHLLHRLIEHLASLKPTWLLFDADWMHTKQAVPHLNRLTTIVAVGRVKWIEGSKTTGKDNVCWYHFVPDNFVTRRAPEFYGRGVAKKV